MSKISEKQVNYIRSLISKSFGNYFASKGNWENKPSFDDFVCTLLSVAIHNKAGYINEYTLTSDQASQVINNLLTGKLEANYKLFLESFYEQNN
jgi:hypothetical protein